METTLVLELGLPEGVDVRRGDVFEAIQAEEGQILLQRIHRRSLSKSSGQKALGINVSDSIGIAERIAGG